MLIHAAAGGVGTAAVQLGRLMGFETFGTASSDEKLERLRELGLNHAINYTREDYEQKIKELTGGEGVDVVFDSLAGEHTAKSLRCCAFWDGWCSSAPPAASAPSSIRSPCMNEASALTGCG